MYQMTTPSFPKLRSRSHQLDSNYSNSFKVIFNNALNSIEKKHLKISQAKIKSKQKERFYQKSTPKLLQDDSKIESNKNILAPLPFLSKILKASRQANTAPITFEKPIFLCPISPKMEIYNQQKDKLIQKRPLAKLQMSRKPLRRFFNSVNHNPQQKFTIQPWLDNQLFSCKFR